MKKKISAVFSILLVFVSLVTPLSSVAEESGNSDEPFTKLIGKEADENIRESKETDAYKKAIEIIRKEGFKFKNESVAVTIKLDNSKWVYHYLESTTNKEPHPYSSMIAINIKDDKSIIKLSEKKGEILETKSYKNGKIVNESFINNEGVILEGSYYMKNGEPQDMTKLNDVINNDSGDIGPRFNWGGFWDCLKDKGSESLPLRAELSAGCYTWCLTGPAGCISCTVINGGLSAGIASYCVYKNW